jgi:hypothetical protein
VIALWSQMIYSAYKGTLPCIDNVPASETIEMITHLSIELLGMCLMVTARFVDFISIFSEESEENIDLLCWCLGQTCLMCMITWHGRTKYETLVLCISAIILPLCLQGRFWRYVILVIMEIILGVLFFETKERENAQVDKRKKKSFKGKKKRTKVT